MSKLTASKAVRSLSQDPHETVYTKWGADEIPGSFVRLFLHREEVMFAVRSTVAAVVPFFRGNTQFYYIVWRQLVTCQLPRGSFQHLLLLEES